jgi:Satellite tobacco necrosis virus coat protein.
MGMPFKRYSNAFSQQAFKKRKITNQKNLGVKTYRGLAALRKKINGELFAVDVAAAAALTSNVGVIGHLNPIAQGDGTSSRTGGNVLMTDLDLFIYWYGTAVNGGAARLIVFCDKQQVLSTAPSVTTVLENATPYSHHKFINLARFSVLYDRVETLNTSDKIANIQKLKIKLQRQAIFGGSSSADIQRNGLYYLVICDVATAYQINSRLYYHDN